MAYFKADNNINRSALLQKYGGKCAYCGCDLTANTLHIDHFVPMRRAMGNCERGDNVIENCNPCCVGCNSSKSSYDLEEWRVKLSNKLARLNLDSAMYRLVKRFGMVKEINKPIIFHFEKYKANG